jgi:single-strand selective monofunctional uracil DNA glycosylase
LDLVIGRMPHPSPASPAANRGWAKQADAALRGLGIV